MFQLDGIHQQKAALYYSLLCLLQNLFNWSSSLLGICNLRFKNVLNVYAMTPQFVCSFFHDTYYPKNSEFYADFKVVDQNFCKQ